MELVKLRERLQKQGQILFEQGNIFLVTDNSTSKRTVSHEFHTLADIETWLRMLEEGKIIKEEKQNEVL